jgi:hypothetical protein
VATVLQDPKTRTTSILNSLDITEKMDLLYQVRDELDICYSTHYSEFLEFMIPAFQFLLKMTEISFESASNEHVLFFI